MKKEFNKNFEDIISIENLLLAWSEFVKGKRSKLDVQEFGLNLMDNIISLHQKLKNHTYKHGFYQAFNISDPKPRNIHKATVRDRLLHHAIYRILYPFFDKTFIADSFSCRKNKGTHKAINRFREFGYKSSKNNTKTVWILKCDIRKFFENIDHQILLNSLKEYIKDEEIIWLLSEIINSFHAKKLNIGLPLGNLTSQVFVNIYMNKFDQFAKHKLKEEYYIRYADDFVIFKNDKIELEELAPKIRIFLSEELGLDLHPDKISIKTLASGIDFLGWVHFTDHRVLRTMTKRRIMKRMEFNKSKETEASYLGLIKHGNCYKLRNNLFV